MLRPVLRAALLLAGVGCSVSAGVTDAQLYSAPSDAEKLGDGLTSLRAVRTAKFDSTVFQFYTEHMSPVQDQKNSLSTVDLAAPKNAQKEYDQGYLHLIRRQLQPALQRLSKATSIYPNFLAAHDALGIAYLNAGQTQQAYDEFARAVALDDHLPGAYLNLACAQLQLQRYADAEESLKKAAAIVPLDLVVLTALTYAQFKNGDYAGVIATSDHVHRRKHQDASLVHLFAAAAWDAQDHLSEAQDELEILLSEDPKPPLLMQVRKLLDQVKQEQLHGMRVPQHPTDAAQALSGTSERMAAAMPVADPVSNVVSRPEGRDQNLAHQVIRVKVEEVAMLFAAIDHGKSVTSLSVSDVQIRDDGKPPQAIVGFHNITQLPLRIGLLIDMSNSITERFRFEESAAGKFLETVVTDPNDLAFVIGFNCAVLVGQDFTPDKTLTARALTRFAPGGGTALWDAVAYGAEKLASRPEERPVARVLVVISDGEDNSSSVSLQQAIWAAQRGEVAVYTVSTKEGARNEFDPLRGTPALKTLSAQTGGTTFTSVTLHDLDRRLADLQQVLRGRYLVYYTPASSQTDGRYHPVEIVAEKDGHKLKVIARKGYYASALLDAGVQ
jgi:VWFA-related protein